MDDIDINVVNKAVKNEKLVRLIILIIIGLLIFLVIYYIYSTLTLEQKNCDTMNSLYSDFPLISTMNTSNTSFSYNLRDYYIKSAYNCCCGGSYKNDFVSLCALKDCIKQGARCLDFEIYSVNNKPVIATSSMDDYSIKETYNSIPFATVMKNIAQYAFSGSTCPNPGDPLILYFRIMSKNKEIYTEMANDIYNTLEDKLLGKKYSYENYGKNLGKEPLKSLIGKIIIIADKSNALFEETPLDEYINIASNSIFMRALRYDDVQYTPDMDELIDYNKKSMTICLPNLNNTPINPSASLAMKYGCQFIAMSFQNFDSNMEYYDLFFDEEGSAFSLKPENLRFISVTLDTPPAPPESYSYAQRDVSTDYYSFSI